MYSTLREELELVMPFLGGLVLFFFLMVELKWMSNDFWIFIFPNTKVMLIISLSSHYITYYTYIFLSFITC